VRAARPASPRDFRGPDRPRRRGLTLSRSLPPSPGAKTAIVKRLVDANAAAAAREAQAAAEIAELKRALSSAKKSDDVDADEVAELRRQLAAARAAAKNEVEVANPAVAFAPRPVS